MKIFIGICIFLFSSIITSSSLAQTKTGCLVQGASELYSNFIGNRNPYYPPDPSPTTPAYNGTLGGGTFVPVDNRNLSDVACDSWYIKSTTDTDCFQYSNGSPPTFVSNGGNGKIATVEKKCPTTPIPIDDHIVVLVILTSGFGFYYIKSKGSRFLSQP